MFDFLKTLFKPATASGETAKERLRLVLLSDHLSLAPDVVESLKRDLMDVISRYVEIDMAHADVTFEHREREIAMLANIPITGVRERKAAQPPPQPAPKPASNVVVESVATAPVAASTPARLESPLPIEAAAPAPQAEPVTLTPANVADPDLGLGVPPSPVMPKAKSKPASGHSGAPAHASNAGPPRRRRRKKYAAAAAAAAASKRAAAQQLGGQASAQA